MRQIVHTSETSCLYAGNSFRKFTEGRKEDEVWWTEKEPNILSYFQDFWRKAEITVDLSPVDIPYIGRLALPTCLSAPLRLGLERQHMPEIPS